MEKRKKLIQAYLFSTLGVVVAGIALIAVNVILDPLNLRMDLTEEHLFTLSDGTRAILKGMDTPVNIRFYFSKDVAQMPVHLKTYAGRVEDILKEYRRYAGSNIEIQRLNPQPDSDAEDSANLDGVVGQPLGAFGTGDRIYLGIAISCLDQTVALPFLSPDRENLLEYDITRSIYRVMHPEKPKLGVLSSLPIMGEMVPPQMMMQMPNMSQKPPWQAIEELKGNFDVVEVDKTADSIDGDIDVLMLVHPKDLEDKTLYAIDQFVLRGGKLLAFLDPMSMIESQEQSPQQRFMPPGASSLGKLLGAWGIEFDTEKVVADMEYMTRIRRRMDAGPEAMPLVLTLTSEAINADDPATSQLENVLYVFGGVFKGDGAEGLTKTVLLHTSEECQLVEKYMAQRSGEAIIKEFSSAEREQELCVRLAGTFKTAFPDGKPAAKDDDKGEAKEEAAGDSLKESATPGAVVLVGDSDMIYDNFCVQKGSIFGQTIVQPINDNLTFLQNLVEQLSGDSNLIGIRSRGTLSRPFEVVRSMQAEAERRYQDRIKALEDEVAETNRKISELQREKKQGEKALLSAEQQEAIRKFREKKAETNRQLKDVRKKFRRDIDSLENRLMVVNIGLMPLLVALGGIALAIVKRRRLVRK